MIAWILILALLWTTAGFAILWLVTRKKLRRLEAENALLSSSAQTASANQPSIQQSSGLAHQGAALSGTSVEKAEQNSNEAATVSEASTGEPAPKAEPTADLGKTVFSQVAAVKPLDTTDTLTYLEVLEGPDSGNKFHLPFTKSVIGRDPVNEITLSDDGLSRKHCYIEWTGNDFLICDNESTNGTLCNDKPVDAQVLEFGDVVTISDTRLRYTCKAIQIKDENPAKAIELLEGCVDLQPDFLTALKHLAFLMERDLRLEKKTAPLWKKISKLEKSLEKRKGKLKDYHVSS